MKFSLPDAALPPPRLISRGTLWSWALILAPYVLGRDFWWRLAGSVLIWAICAGIMTGQIGRGNTELAGATRGWDNFVSACFVFVLALGFVGMTSFPRLRNDNWFPTWWGAVAVLLTAGQVAFAVRLTWHSAEFLSRGLMVCFVPILVWFNVWSLQYVNGAFDVGPLRIQQAVVVSKGVLRSSKSGPSYLVRFRLSNGHLSEMRVTSQLHDGTDAGQIIEVRTKSGALGAEWIVEIL